MKLKLYSLSAAASTVTVSDELFNGDINAELIAQAVHVYRSNQRQSAAHTKSRGEVNKTGAKWFKQKGTGNARHGARTAPQFVGGGRAHGPTGLENWTRVMPKKMGRKAVVSALSAQAQSKCVSIFADLDQISGKTKDAAAVLTPFTQEAGVKLLIVMDNSHESVLRAFGNVDNVTLTRADRLNTFEVAEADHVLIMKPALEVLETRLLQNKNEAK